MGDADPFCSKLRFRSGLIIAANGCASDRVDAAAHDDQWTKQTHRDDPPGVPTTAFTTIRDHGRVSSGGK